MTAKYGQTHHNAVNQISGVEFENFDEVSDNLLVRLSQSYLGPYETSIKEFFCENS